MAQKRSTNSGKRRTTTSRSKAKRPRTRLNLPQKALISGIGLIFLTALIVLSMLSPNQGQLTAALAGIMWQLFGWGGLVVPVMMGLTGFYLVLWGMQQAPELTYRRLTGLLLFFLTAEAFASLGYVSFRADLPDVWAVAEAQTGGGYLGGILVWALQRIAGDWGALLAFLLLGIFSVFLMTGLTRTDVVEALRLWWQRWREATAVPEPDESPLPPIRRETGKRVPAAPATPAVNQTAAQPQTAAEPAPARGNRRAARETAADAKPEPAPPEPIFVGRNAPHNWILPQLTEMLESGGEQANSDAVIREQVEVIEHTLESFGAPATVVEISQGPTVIQYGVEPNFIEQRSGKRTKVKVGKIASLADDLALALAARTIRVQAPVPGKGYVGIEVPNVNKAMVSLRDVMESAEFNKLKPGLRIGLGQNVAGQPVAADLTAMPHLLIAGTTGSGKSVCVNGIIACLLLQNTPDQLKMVMVDPKRVELTGYNGIPHLVAPVVVDLERVVGTLQWAMREMDSRYQRFSAIAARNIVDYNGKMAAKGEDRLPHIVIIIDELADLMMLAPEDTERGITRLAQMARATGIHMIIATQRPSVDVVTGLIKANFPARIAFAVASSTDSRVILDTTGAERLLGQGDMLFQSPDAAAPLRLQGCYVSDEELNRIIRYWQTAQRFSLVQDRRPAEPVLPAAPVEGEDGTVASDAIPAPDAAPPPTAGRSAPPPVQQPLWEELQAQEEAAKFGDELFEEAVALVRQLNKASTSLLQRRFRIGYTRAARLIDMMEEQGIIGPPTGTSKAREVVVLDHGEEEADASEENN
jgi:DNA segregation ATPase FtsK/SpoIIIE, S-DNA-T family